MRFFVTFFMLISLALVPMAADAAAGKTHAPTVPDQTLLVNTIDELAAMFDPEVCGECHDDIYEQWKHSPKSHSFSTERLLQTWRTFINQGLDRETKADWSGHAVNRMSIKSHCLWCHDPRIKYASDDLVADIIDKIVTAVDDPDQAKKDAAVKELSKLNLNCYGCHNLFAVEGGYWANTPPPDAIYGPSGDVEMENDSEGAYWSATTIKSDYMSSSKFCARCHHGCPDSVPFWQCQTLYTSYITNYALKHGEDAKRCHDCHMEKDPDSELASHTFPGVHNKDFFADALDIAIDAEITHFINNYENELSPTLCLDVTITSNSGHGLPNG